MRIVIPVLAMVLGVPPLLIAQEQAAASLPIRKIVLYKHGVGYFERQGTIEGDAMVTLSFKSQEMKDVLKSLFAVDQGGGRIGTIVYDSKDPLSKQLEDILFRVPEERALTAFLQQLKGARVRIAVASQSYEGSILGLEPVQSAGPQGGITTRHRLVLLGSGGSIQTVELLDATGVEILDDVLRRDLARMMEIYARSRRADRKIVEIRGQGEGSRDVRVGYIIETPIWKTSYRLLMDGEEPALIQGWAIVENQTDEDWKDVGLSFVAGSPMSFVMDLYTSYYPQRPVISMGAAAAVAPTGAPPEAARPAAPKPEMRRNLAAKERLAEERERGADGDFVKEMEESLAPDTIAQEVGELFSYTARSPVSIRQGQAALVPILQERLAQGRRVLYYRAELSQHPSHAFDLRNSTLLTLEKGPVTFFEGATCLGEGLMTRTLGPGDHLIVPYALETSVEVERRSRGEPMPVTRATLVNGVLTLFRREAVVAHYAVRNRSDKAFDFRLDHPRAGQDHQLVEPAEAAETIGGYLRFQLALPALGEASLTVREEREISTEIGILSQSPEQLRVYLQQPWLTPEARQALDQVAALMEERAAASRAIEQAERDVAMLAQDQERIRKNMEVLRDAPAEREVRTAYLERLQKADARLDTLRAEIAEAQERRRALEKQLADALANLRG